MPNEVSLRATNIGDNQTAAPVHACLRLHDVGAQAWTDVTTAGLPVTGSVTLGGSLPAGTNNIGDVDVLSIAAGDNNIGNVDVVTLPALPAGTNNIGDVDVLSLPALPTGSNNIGDVDVLTLPGIAGSVAHDAAETGNPVAVAGVAETPDDTAPANQVSAEADRVRLAACRDGAQYVHPHPPRIWHYSNQSSATQTDTEIKAAAASLSHYISDIYVAAKGAVDITVEQGTATFKWRYYADAAGAGAMATFRVPLKLTANTSVTYTTSGAIEHTIVMTGYTAP